MWEKSLSLMLPHHGLLRMKNKKAIAVSDDRLKRGKGGREYQMMPAHVAKAN